jgi:hypothetical protein
VVIPFARALVPLVPKTEVRMRRDFKQLLSLMQTVVRVNQHHRERRNGAIVAHLKDYEWGRKLLLSSFKTSTSGGITDAVRATCLAVPEGDNAVSQADLARDLGLSKHTISYRVRRALKGGWLVNLEKRSGYPYRLVRGEPLPEDQSPLPTVEELRKALGRPPDWDGYWDGPQATGGVRQTEQASQCPNGLGGTGSAPTHPSPDGVASGPSTNGTDPSMNGFHADPDDPDTEVFK